jgi:hypothetical protein
MSYPPRRDLHPAFRAEIQRVIHQASQKQRNSMRCVLGLDYLGTETLRASAHHQVQPHLYPSPEKRQQKTTPNELEL